MQHRCCLRVMATMALLALSGCGVDACRPSLAARIPLARIDTDARLMVPVEIDRKQARLLLDTGAETTVLTDTAFVRLKGQERILERKIISGVGGSQMVGEVELWRLGLGGVGVQLRIYVVDHTVLPPVPPAEGMLGLNALSGFDVDLDVVGNTLGLYRDDGGCATPSTWMAGKTYLLDLLPPTKGGGAPRFVVMINGQRLVAEIDTGAPNTILFRSGAERLGLRAGREAVRGIGSGSTRAATVVIDRIGVGRLDLRDMKVTVLDENLMEPVDLLLGVDFVRSVHVWLGSGARKIVLEYPPLATR